MQSTGKLSDHRTSTTAKHLALCNGKYRQRLECSLLDAIGNALQQFLVSIRVKVRVSTIVRVSIY